MDNRTLDLIEMLYQTVDEAYGVPFGKGRCVVERERVLDILKRLKNRLQCKVSLELVGTMQQIIAEAPKVPFGKDRYVIEGERFLEIVGELHALNRN